jgi:hypothetical protein
MKNKQLKTYVFTWRTQPMKGIPSEMHTTKITASNVIYATQQLRAELGLPYVNICSIKILNGVGYNETAP